MNQLLLQLKNLIRQALAPTIVITIIFFLNYFYFGIDNTLIGPFATLSFLRFRNINNHYECMLKTFCIYLIMAIVAYFAVMSLPLCILVNAVALFWLAYCLIDEYNPTNYFPAGMALIFFEIAPASSSAMLVTRIEALGASFLIIFGFIILQSFIRPSRNPLYQYIKNGLDNCKKQLDAFEQHDTIKLKTLHQELCTINKNISDEIYEYNRASIRLTDRINWYCRFVALFQVINFFTLEESYPSNNLKDMREILNRFSTAFQDRTPDPDYKRLRFRTSRPNLRIFRFRFALRLTIMITPCLIFAYIVPFENRYWIAISVFFMMIPVYEHTHTRIRQRVAGTCIGIIACFFLFSIFRQFPGRAALMTFANFMIYGSKSYGIMVAYITCSALAIQTISSSITAALLERLIYTGIGAVIAFIGNKLVFPIHIRQEMFNLIGQLNEQKEKMRELTLEKHSNNKERHYQKDQLIIKSYLLMKRLQAYHDMLPESQQNDSFKDYEKKYFQKMASFLKKYIGDAV